MGLSGEMLKHNSQIKAAFIDQK